MASNRKDISNIDLSNNTLLTSSEQNITHDDLNENNINNSSIVSINEEHKSEDENNKYREPPLQNISDIIDSIKSTSEISIKSIDTEYVADLHETSLSSSEINLSKSNNLNEKDDVWNVCENWHGLTGSSNTVECSQQNVPKKRIKASYLDKCSEWDFIKNSKSSFNLPLIINGSKCKPVKQGKLIINIQETCAFDSILQLVVSGIVTHATYRNAISLSSNDIFQLAKSILEHGRLLSIHYNQRASILQNLSLFNDALTTYTRGIKRLNANCNAAHLAEYLFNNEPSCIYNKFCSCNVVNIRQTITCSINVDILLQEGLQYMQKAIDDAKDLKSKCRTCNASAEYNITYGKHIIIDTSVFTDDKYTNRRLDIRHDLNSLAKTIVLNNINYILVGVVNYTQYNDKNGHYSAFAFAGTRWYEYDDLQKKRMIAKSTQVINPHMILYVRCD